MPAERADASAYTASSSAEGSKRPAAQDRAKGGAVKEQRQSIRQAILLSLDSSDKTSDQTRPEAKQPQRVGGREEMNATDVGLTQTSRSEGTVESKEGCIGRRVEVFWEQEDRWFPGVIIGWRITSHAPRRVAHHVEYDDGDGQWHHLEVNSKDPDSFRFRWLDAHTPAPEGGSSRDPVKPPVYLLDSDDEVDGKAAAGKTTTVFLLDSDDEEDGKAAAADDGDGFWD